MVTRYVTTVKAFGVGARWIVNRERARPSAARWQRIRRSDLNRQVRRTGRARIRRTSVACRSASATSVRGSGIGSVAFLESGMRRRRLWRCALRRATIKNFSEAKW